jgi:hypothetical protein
MLNELGLSALQAVAGHSVVIRGGGRCLSESAESCRKAEGEQQDCETIKSHANGAPGEAGML